MLDIVIQQAWMIWKLYLLGRKNNEHGKEVRLRKRRRERHVSFLLNNDLILEQQQAYQSTIPQDEN